MKNGFIPVLQNNEMVYQKRFRPSVECMFVSEILKASKMEDYVYVELNSECPNLYLNPYYSVCRCHPVLN